MARLKVRLVQVRCKRCGKEVQAASRSLYGLDALKAKFGVICQDCGRDEVAGLNEEIGRQMAERSRR
jgi:DNA-directed RNA polymerase subunit RPC12/RpoP